MNITLGATARLRVAETVETPFAENADLTMAEGAVLELPQGAEVFIRKGMYGTKHLPHGTFTGEKGTGVVVQPWIRGGGIIHIRTGNGFIVIIR